MPVELEFVLLVVEAVDEFDVRLLIKVEADTPPERW